MVLARMRNRFPPNLLPPFHPTAAQVLRSTKMAKHRSEYGHHTRSRFLYRSSKYPHLIKFETRVTLRQRICYWQIHLEEEINIPLSRDGDTWATRCAQHVLTSGAPYRVAIEAHDGTLLHRRDPYARHADYNSSWCYADDPALFPWSDAHPDAAYPRSFPPAMDEYVIYELHVGSFTPGGTFRSAEERLEHVAALGFTAIQLMPISEFADAWGYNPRQLLAVHGPYGSPDDLRALIDHAHRSARTLAPTLTTALLPLLCTAAPPAPPPRLRRIGRALVAGSSRGRGG
jgi:hypothetical protein